jgi:hypothetical protein
LPKAWPGRPRVVRRNRLHVGLKRAADGDVTRAAVPPMPPPRERIADRRQRGDGEHRADRRRIRVAGGSVSARTIPSPA